MRIHKSGNNPPKPMDLIRDQAKRYTVTLWKEYTYTIRAESAEDAVRKISRGRFDFEKIDESKVDDLLVLEKSKEVFRESPVRDFEEWLMNMAETIDDPAMKQMLQQVVGKFHAFLDQPSVWKSEEQQT